MKHCPSCQQEIQEELTECPHCGIIFSKWKGHFPPKPRISDSEGSPSKEKPLEKEETPPESRSYYSYAGLAITLIGLGLQIYGVHDAEARAGADAIAGFLVSAIGLALYADSKGHSTIVGFFLGFIMFIGPVLGLLYFRGKTKSKAVLTAIKPGESISLRSYLYFRRFRLGMWFLVGSYLAYLSYQSFSAFIIIFYAGFVAFISLVITVFRGIGNQIKPSDKSKVAIYDNFFRAMLCVALMALMALGYRSLNEDMDQRTSMAITAIERYQVDRGKYPESLSQLVPLYLSEVPRCTRKQRLHYNNKENGSFGITCRTYGFMNHSYDSETKQWRDWD